MHSSDFESSWHRSSGDPIIGLLEMVEKANNFKWLLPAKIRAGGTMDITQELAETPIPSKYIQDQMGIESPRRIPRR